MTLPTLKVLQGYHTGSSGNSLLPTLKHKPSKRPSQVQSRNPDDFGFAFISAQNPDVPTYETGNTPTLRIAHPKSQSVVFSNIPVI